MTEDFQRKYHRQERQLPLEEQVSFQHRWEILLLLEAAEGAGMALR